MSGRPIKRASAILAAALGCVAAASAGAGEVSGTDQWAGRARHLAVVNPPVPADDGSTVSLRGEWEFVQYRHGIEVRDLRYAEERDFWGREGIWKDARKIQVPGCWDAQGVGEEGPAYGYGCRENSEGLRLRSRHLGNGFYRRKVAIPAEWAGRRVWLKVGRVQTQGWFWIDGKGVAMVSEAHRALKWEITDLVRPGEECTVMAEVDNSYPFRNSQILSYHRWGGLLRDVEIESTGETWIDDAWVRGDFDARCAEAHVTVRGLQSGRDATVRVTVEGESAEAPAREGENVLRVPLAGFRPWTPEHPNLYTARVEVVCAGVPAPGRRYERFGVRKLEVVGKEFRLNGRPFFFRGFGDDHTYPVTGCSPASKEYHLAHLRTARAAGFNFVRTHTHCEMPEYFDAADEAGVFVQPELSYNCDESSGEVFSFDPVRDARAIWEGYRSHPAFAVYSGGNEGTLGPHGGKALFDWVHAHDPDRLVVEQDGGTYFMGHRADTSDYASGPMSMWERGSFNPRAFICHEYANLAVKGDARMEGDYTGIWLPRMTRAMRRERLAPAGLGDGWGDRLQDAQHDLQRLWAVRSLEHARKDPFCDGYIYWTIVDYTHFDKKAGAPTCQGLFDPFWRPKPHGATPAEVAVVNSPSAILLDTENRERVYAEDRDPMLCCGSNRRMVVDETNRVFAAGEKIHAEFILAHYAEEALDGAKLEWRLVADGATLSAGSSGTGRQEPGPARTVAKAVVSVPDVPRPVKARLEASVGPAIRNGWDFWLFPATERPVQPANVVVAGFGSAEAASARAAGKSVLLVGNRRGERDITLGWWGLSWRDPKWTQNGMAVLKHPLFCDFPYEPFLSPLLFRIVGQGTPLPVEGFSEGDFVVVGEGVDDFKLYLAAKTRADGGREVFVSGLDVFADLPEARTLLRDIFAYLNESERERGR